MSGIYIPGVTVPEDNTILLRIFPESDGICYTEQLDIDEDILDKFFAIPVPDHGRLIDASEKIRVQMYDDMTEDYHIAEMTIDDLLSQGWVEADAPTIIPKSGGTNNE